MEEKGGGELQAGSVLTPLPFLRRRRHTSVMTKEFCPACGKPSLIKVRAGAAARPAGRRHSRARATTAGLTVVACPFHPAAHSQAPTYTNRNGRQTVIIPRQRKSQLRGTQVRGTDTRRRSCSPSRLPPAHPRAAASVWFQFSLPMPKGGRKGNIILREDQSEYLRSRPKVRARRRAVAAATTRRWDPPGSLWSTAPFSTFIRTEAWTSSATPTSSTRRPLARCAASSRHAALALAGATFLPLT